MWTNLKDVSKLSCPLVSLASVKFLMFFIQHQKLLGPPLFCDVSNSSFIFQLNKGMMCVYLKYTTCCWNFQCEHATQAIYTTTWHVAVPEVLHKPKGTIKI